MTDTAGIIDEIRAALEKVQHSEWFMSPWHVEEDASAVRNSNDFSFIANTSSDSFAAFIATVNPLAIRALLDHVAAQAEEIERLRKAQSYTYVGRGGKVVLARDLEDRAEAAEARVRELEGALKDIAQSDDIENALDPERNKRVARAILTGEQQ